ncbi:peptidoglycan-binding protein [Nocardiopsis alba]|uniref:peptidoglycan-binding domain-containing protein n=1 Tax=Nocardiopsis alba TaxID=53437 RepID=UPI00368CAD17
MTILVDNTLSGEPGLQVTNARLVESAEAGTVTIAAGGTRAVYDDTRAIHGRPAIRIASGHHRGETPRLRVTLPSTGPWSARWYAWIPDLASAGLGTGEVRSLAVLPTHAWVAHPTAAGNLGSRLHIPDLAAPSISWDDETGTATGLAQWVRIELRYSGGASGTFESRAYPGHEPTRHRGNRWNSWPDLGRTLDLTAYRWRRRATLYWGDQGVAVRDLQLELLDLGYNLGPAGADGDFGNATLSAVQSFQTARGLSPVDGIPGPETRAAMDLALGRVPPPTWISHLAIADGPWIGPAEPPPEPAHRRRLHVGYLPI